MVQTWPWIFVSIIVALLTRKGQGTQSRNASRNCFWNRYWGRAVSYWPILSLPRLTVPEVLEEVTRPRFPLVSTVANLNFNIFYQQHQLFCLLLTFKKLQTTFRVSMWPKTYKACLALVRATFIRCLSLTNLNKQIEKEHKDDARFHRKAHSLSSNYLCLRTKIKLKRNITLPMYGYTFITVLKKNHITYKTWDSSYPIEPRTFFARTQLKIITSFSLPWK